MADLEGVKVAKDYHVDVPFAINDGFYVKGANNLDWGMKNICPTFLIPKVGTRLCSPLTMDTLWGQLPDWSVWIW